MKKAVSELSMTVVVIMGAVAIIGAFYYIYNNFIYSFFTDDVISGDGESSDGTIDLSEIILLEDIELEGKTIASLFSELSGDYELSIDDETSNKLINKVSNLLSDGLNNVSCTESCKDYDVDTEASYSYSLYSVGDYYLVNAVSEDNDSYSFVYKENSFLWFKSYELVSVDTTDLTSSVKDASDLKEGELSSSDDTENGDSGANINYDLDNAYISEASVETSSSQMFYSNRSDALDIYNGNVSSIVLLNTYNSGVIVKSATGFFVSSDIIATSYQYIKQSLIEGSFVSAVTSSDESYDVDGVILLDEETDIALLKVNGTSDNIVTFSDNIEEGNQVLLLGTFSGFGVSGQVGKNLGVGDLQTNLLYVAEENIGSPLFNTSGEVIGMVTGLSVGKSFSSSISSTVIEEYIKSVNKSVYYSFDELKRKYYIYDVEVEEVISNIDELLKDENISEIISNVGLDVVEFNDIGDVYCLRFINETILDNTDVMDNFGEYLSSNKYTLVLNGDIKKKYVGTKYTVSMLSSFNYIIVIVEKL